MLVAIEGHSYSGKTTIITQLQRQKPTIVIAEHDAYAGGIDKYPPFPPVKKGMAEHSVDFFARLEAKRYDDIATQDDNQVIYMDRTFISTVLFAKYMERLEIPGEYHAYRYAKEIFESLFASGIDTLPDHIVLVAPDSITTYHERLDRKVSVDRLRTDDAYRFFTREYRHVLEPYERRGLLTTVVSRNSAQSLVRAVDTIMTIAPKALTTNDKIAIMKELLELL